MVSIKVPPLRERKDDIENIVQYFIQRFNRELDKEIKGIAPELLNEFQVYHWPGNVRELQSIIQRGMVLCQKDVLTLEESGSFSRIRPSSGKAGNMEEILSNAANELLQKGGPNIYKEAVSTFERLLIEKALDLNKNNQALTARMLGISRNTLKAKTGKD